MHWLAKKKPGQASGQLVPADEQVTHPANLVAMAVQQGAELDKIEKLMALQERWEANEARKAYVAAMNSFKKNPPALYKTKHVHYETSKGLVDYHHGDIGIIANVISEALAVHDLSFRWDQEQLDGGLIRVTCVVTHAMGHSESNFLQSGADQSGGKNNIQAIGSSVKYLRRYTLEGAVGLATQDMDDDGRGANNLPQIDVITEDQANEVHAKITENGVSMDAFLIWLRGTMKCENISDINVKVIDRVNERIDSAIRAKQNAKD